VHQLVESANPKRFILTGSSARKLRRGSANLLAGRLIERSMHPFMAAELGAQFDLQLALKQGLVPLVVDAVQPAATLASYASLYLHEEVQAEALVRNVGGFARFLEAISFSHGSTLNLSEVARECEIGRKTVEGYLAILEDLLLSFRIPIFSKRAKRQLVVHEKFYFFDTGVFRSLRPAGPLDKPAEIEGQALEGLIAQHLRAWLAYRKDALGQAVHEQAQLYYWRTKSGSEVDFVIYGADVFVAVEVKRSDKVNSHDLRALNAFKQDYPEAQTLLLYLGARPMVMGDVQIMPCASFLKALAP
jgi:predicted AAA+ superfamily ATPase